jgi:hypothetical protein
MHSRKRPRVGRVTIYYHVYEEVLITQDSLSVRVTWDACHRGEGSVTDAANSGSEYVCLKYQIYLHHTR